MAIKIIKKGDRNWIAIQKFEGTCTNCGCQVEARHEDLRRISAPYREFVIHRLPCPNPDCNFSIIPTISQKVDNCK